MNLITATWVSEFAIMRLQQSTSDNSMVCTILRRNRRKKLKKLQFPLHTANDRCKEQTIREWWSWGKKDGRDQSELRRDRDHCGVLWGKERKKHIYAQRRTKRRRKFFFLFSNSRKWKSAVKMRIYSIISGGCCFRRKTHGKLDSTKSSLVDGEVHMFFSGALECWTCWWFLDIWGFCRCLRPCHWGY